MFHVRTPNRRANAVIGNTNGTRTVYSSLRRKPESKGLVKMDSAPPFVLSLSKHERREKYRNLLIASAVHPSTMLRANGMIAYLDSNDSPACALITEQLT